MAFTTATTRCAGDNITVCIWNTCVVDNVNASAPAVVTTKGDIVAATGCKAITRLAGGCPGDLITYCACTCTGLTTAALSCGCKFDGDQLDVDFTPCNYTPDACVAEASDADDLAAHLKGIDTTLGAFSGNAKAFATVASNGTLQANSFNISGVVRNGCGCYTVSFNTNFANANYAALVTIETGGTDNKAVVDCPAVGSIKVVTETEGGIAQDMPFHLVAFGCQ